MHFEFNGFIRSYELAADRKSEMFERRVKWISTLFDFKV